MQLSLQIFRNRNFLFSQFISGWLMETVPVRQIFFWGGALEILVAGLIFCIPVIRYYTGQQATQAVS